MEESKINTEDPLFKKQIEPLLKCVNEMVQATDMKFVLHVLMHVLTETMESEGGMMLFKVKSKTSTGTRSGIACLGDGLSAYEMIAMLEGAKLEILWDQKMESMLNQTVSQEKRNEPAPTTH